MLGDGRERICLVPVQRSLSAGADVSGETAVWGSLWRRHSHQRFAGALVDLRGVG